ncbi:MAG: LptF/LptG family permease [Planctomycetes bacterium]|nr:LptF/LptG family permease [Planctomycetota bacterium]
MIILDRYVLRIYVKVLAVSFLSLTGLFIVIDMFGNLEEFITYGERQGSLLGVLTDYYGAHVLSFYDRISGLLALIAAVFTITWLQRTNEMTALMAAGIPKARIVRPLLVATVAVALVAAANREFTLPRVRDKLSRNAQDWLGETAKELKPTRDFRTGILIGGQTTVAAHKQINAPSFRLPRTLNHYGKQLAARQANYWPLTADRPSGYYLKDVTQPSNLAGIDPRGQQVILTHRDADWIEPADCFVVSDVTFEHLSVKGVWYKYASTWELIRALRNPSLDYGADARVTVHKRFLEPMLDVTLLLLGLPLVLARSNKNVFVAAAKCLLLVAGYFLITLACQTLGRNTFLVSPALAAWLPLLILAPLAHMAALRRWE